MRAPLQSIKGFASAASATKQLGTNNTKVMVDNRPQVVAQRKLQQSADASLVKKRSPIQAQKMRPLPQGVIQRTTWVFKKNGWQVKSSSTTDTDAWPAPNGDFPRGNFKKGDEYDQNTGQVTSGTKESHALDPLIQPGGDFGGVYKDRANTAYGIFNQNTTLQGPHTLAHIAKRTAIEVRTELEPGFNIHTLRNRSSLFPSAGQSRALIAAYEKGVGIDLDKSLKKIHNSIYQDKLEQKNDSSLKDEERNIATVEASELCVVATCSLEKEASKDELKHKNEDRYEAKKDLVSTLNRKNKKKLPKLTTFDVPKKGFSAKYYEQYVLDFAAVAVGKPIKELDVESESEYSSLDTDEEATKEKLVKRRAIKKKEYHSDEEEKEDPKDGAYSTKPIRKRKRKKGNSGNGNAGSKPKKRKTK